MNTNYWINKVMGEMYTDSTGEFWVGLSNTAPNADGTGFHEPTGNNYGRVRVTQFTAPEDGCVKNVEALSFPRSTGIWFDSDAKAAYWLLFDGETPEAHLLSSGSLDEQKTIESNTVITVAAETLSITLSDYAPA